MATSDRATTPALSIDRAALRRDCEEQSLILPIALLDDAAFEHNRRILYDAFGAMPGMKMRIASKSLRCGQLIRRLLDADTTGEVVAGIMAFRVAEARHLVESHGVIDVLVAYPVVSPVEAKLMAELAGKLDSAPDGCASIVCDSPAQIEPLAAAGRAAGVEVPVVLEIDLAYKPFGERGPVLGARRSPLSTARAVREAAEVVRATDGVRMHGLMGYEAHHAATPDRPHERAFKRISRPAIEKLRAEVDAALRQAGFGDLPLLNGGGSGTYPQTAASPYVNEVAVGSAFYKSALFDRHAALAEFEPSLYYALQVVRVPPGGGWVTCFGGGYYASGGGTSPATAAPEGLKPSSAESFGEVQTPLRVPNGVHLEPGDLVLCRASKAGEPLERFATLHLLKEGKLVESMPTYRGEGQCFG